MNKVYSVGNAFKHVNCYPSASTSWTKTTRFPHHLGVKKSWLHPNYGQLQKSAETGEFHAVFGSNRFPKVHLEH